MHQAPQGAVPPGADLTVSPRLVKPSSQFGNLCNAYAKAINKACDRTGSLLENPFGRQPVTSESYFAHLIVYIHQNPQKHGFVPDFRQWPFSSYHATVSEKPTRLEREQMLAWFQGSARPEQSHRRIRNEGSIAHLIVDDFDGRDQTLRLESSVF